jgi:hypothetical protein
VVYLLPFRLEYRDEESKTGLNLHKRVRARVLALPSFWVHLETW